MKTTLPPKRMPDTDSILKTDLTEYRWITHAEAKARIEWWNGEYSCTMVTRADGRVFIACHLVFDRMNYETTINTLPRPIDNGTIVDKFIYPVKD